MTACDRPGCRGTIAPTGFCDECGHRPASGRPAGTAVPGATVAVPVAPPVPAVPHSAYSSAASATGDGLISLPTVAVPDPSELVVPDPKPPRGGRVCGKDGCPAVVGVGYGGQPAEPSGYCHRCGHPYSFVPQLRPGELLNDQYQVVGCVAHGGLGWIYLARDTQLEGHHVALKGLINANDSTALSVAEAERRFLVALDHPDIVRIINFVTWKATGYIVMEFVVGRPLRELLDRETQQQVLGGPLRLDHVAAYGCRILDALEYLHGRGLLYCDMKPDNVIHHGGRIKIIDLGAVRRIDDHESPRVHTERYLPLEELASGFSVLSDLYTVGRTLHELAASAAPSPGEESFVRLIERSLSPHQQARFSSAAEMSLQLRGVLREIRALSTGEQQIAQSAVFSPNATLLDAGLGSVPPLRHWLRPADGAPPLDPGPPSPAQVAVGLPVPVPHTDAPAAARELQNHDASLARGALEAATASLRRAYQLLRGAARYDWRIAWRCGLLLLAHGDPQDGKSPVHEALGLEPDDRTRAADWFDAVYSALPGEPAPKLALGYCAERRGEMALAERFYQAVWQRDHSEGSAAFGLARMHLARQDRAGAVQVLSLVPDFSPYRDAARLAAVRISAGWLAGRPPSVEDVRRALDGFPGLRLDGGRTDGEERVRLTAEIRESALYWVGTAGPLADLDGGRLLGSPLDEVCLRELLERSFRDLARQASTRDEHEALIDRANQVRPLTLR